MIRHEPSRVTGMQIFDRHRLLLFSMAYRMLGSVMDAEDIVQEAYLRWRGTGEEVRSPKAYLSTVVTRLAIDELRSAQARREHYVGPWLPEPLARDRRSLRRRRVPDYGRVPLDGLPDEAEHFERFACRPSAPISVERCSH
jgi:DNA-directed RNA polymerase specialized sigma24 family protein